jgi:hypothetical protein
VTTCVEPGRPPLRGGDGGRRPGRLGALGRWLAGRSDQAVFAACLAGIALGIGVFLVVPLLPQFGPIHKLPTTLDYNVSGKPEGRVTGFWVLAMGSFACAVWQWRRGRKPGLPLLVAGAVLLTGLALLVPPVASEDVYAYSFYGKVQHTYGANPYLSVPAQHPLDPWYPLWSWRFVGPVYGPPFLLLLRLVAVLAGPSLLAWVIWMKLLLVAAELAAVWLLVRVARERGGDPGWPLLLIACNPMVLQAVAMSAHVDALLLLLVAGALLAHGRGRHLVAFGLLVLAFVVKLYLGPLAGLYGLWLAFGREPGRPLARRLRSFAGLGALGAAITALCYLPYASAGTRVVTSILDVGEHFSTGSPPNLVRRALAWLLPAAFGVVDTSAARIGAQTGRLLSAVAVTVVLALAARRVARSPDPWPVMATWFLAYLLLTPWIFYWHEVPLLGIVAVLPWSLTSLVAVVLSINLVPILPQVRGVPTSATSATRELGNTAVGLAARYGAALAVLAAGLRARRRGERPPTVTKASADAEPDGGGT